MESDPIIAEVETVSIICGVILRGGVCGESRVIVVGTDNANVFSWPRLGKARVGKARRALPAFLLWWVKYNIEILPYFIRTRHNLSADYSTRCLESELRDWANRFQMTQVAVPRCWSDFAKMSDAIPWGSEDGHTLQVKPALTPGACDITVAEWNGSSLLPMSRAGQFGCQTLALTSR